MNPTASYIALAVFVIGMLVTIFFAISTDYEANAEKERMDQKGGKHGNMKKAILRILAILAAAVLVFIADSFIDWNAILYRIENVWGRATARIFGDGRIGEILRYYIGPFAAIAGVFFLLCIIFAVAYKKKKHAVSFVLALLSAILSLGGAIVWRVAWIDRYYRSYGRKWMLIKWLPVAFVALIVLLLMIKCIKAKKQKDEELRDQKEAARQQRAQQAEERKAARDEKIEQVRNAVSAGTEKIVSQAKESAASLASTTKQIIADGNNPVGGTASDNLPAGGLSAPETFIPQIGGDEYALEKIKGLHDLLKSGFVTQEEFEQKKQELLGKV